MDNMQRQMTRTAKAPRRGRCADCYWNCGPLRDSCCHDAVLGALAAITCKIDIARGSDKLCGSTAKFWQPKE